MEQLRFPELVDIETVSEAPWRRGAVREEDGGGAAGTDGQGAWLHFRFDLADIRKWVEEQRRPDTS